MRLPQRPLANVGYSRESLTLGSIFLVVHPTFLGVWPPIVSRKLATGAYDAPKYLLGSPVQVAAEQYVGK